jgi:hypothetical protein
MKSKIMLALLFILSLFISTTSDVIEEKQSNFETYGSSTANFIHLNEYKNVASITCDPTEKHIIFVFSSTGELDKLINRLKAPPPIFINIDNLCEGSQVRRYIEYKITGLTFNMSVAPIKFVYPTISEKQTNHETHSYPSDHFIHLNEFTSRALINCDSTGNHIILIFNSMANLDKMLDRLKTSPPIYIYIDNLCEGNQIRRYIDHTISGLTMNMRVASTMINHPNTIEKTIKNTIDRTNKVSGTFEGKHFTLNYNTIGYSNDHFISGSEIKNIADIKCNVDETRLLIVFGSTSDLNKLLNHLSNTRPMFFIIDDVCEGSMIRRIIDYNISNLKMELYTTPARYDEIFSDADISYETNDIPICLGVNSKDCKTAENDIPFYHNDYVDVVCKNCFLGLSTNVFFDMKIKWFKLESVSGGFRNSQINGELVVDTKGKYHWSLDLDKTYPVVKPTTIITLHIGIIPIRIWFEIPLEEKLDLNLDLQGEVKLGAKMNLMLGDDYISWSNNQWKIFKDNPIFSWEPVFDTSAYLNFDMVEALNPTFILHVDDLYSFWLMVEPTLIGKVTGSEADKQVCETLSYNIDVDVKSEIDVNIPWVHEKWDKTFGPYNIIHKDGKISSECKKF